MILKITLILVLISCAIATAAATFYIQGTYLGINGNVCCFERCSHILYCHDERPDLACKNHPECYEKFAAAGFPLAYLRDNPGISAIGSFGIEDFYLLQFLADVGIYFIVYAIIFVIIADVIGKRKVKN